MFSPDVASVEVEGVPARPAFDLVAAVARVPDERVVAAAEESDVRALIAVEDVVAGPAEQLLRAGASAHDVVATVTLERQLRAGLAGSDHGQRVRVVAAAHPKLLDIGRAERRGIAREDPLLTARRRQLDRVRRRRAVVDRGVGSAGAVGLDDVVGLGAGDAHLGGESAYHER